MSKRTIIIRDNISSIIPKIPSLFYELTDDGSLFLLVSTEYDEHGCVKFDFMNLINESIKVGYLYVNTIVYPTAEYQDVSFKDNVRYVVWLCKNKDLYHFNKDPIREKHIWKDVEWGKRKKNYNDKGKDPGNVWIPTEDDGMAHITNHIILSDDEVIRKLIKMTESENSNKLILNKIQKINQNLRFDKHENNNVSTIDSKVIFSSSENMNEVKDGLLTTIVTSPPYWNLKDYFKKGQIGQESYEVYINRMTSVWRESFRMLNDNGSLWININIRVQNNHVILIPFDIVNECKKLGFYYKGIIIWHKSSGIPASPKNISDHYEYILLFTKNKNFAVNHDFLNSLTDYKNSLINCGAFWNINRKAGSVGKKYIHPAIYPNELVSRIVLLSSINGNYILDPFLGSGTSLIASNNNNRSFIGYEFNEGFKELMESRFNKELNDSITVNFIDRK